jgi:hypothetical protein
MRSMYATTMHVAACALLVVALPSSTARQRATALPQQAPVTPSSTAGAAGGSVTPLRRDSTAAAPNVKLSGRLFYDGGSRPVGGATVTLTSLNRRPVVKRAVTTDASGAYTIDSLPRDDYEFVVDVPDGQSLTQRLHVDSTLNRDVILSATPPDAGPSWRETALTTAFALLYFMTIAFARWHNIARSVNELLERELRAVELRVQTEVGDHPTAQLERLRATVRQLRADEKEARTERGWPLLDFLLWSRGRENALWAELHEIERQLAAFLAPPEQVEVYLRTTQAELMHLNTPTALALANAINDSLRLTAPTDDAQRARFQSTRQALLGRGLSLIFFERDDRFSSLMEWQNKAGWLIFAALLIVVFLTIAAGHAVLFLAGAAGGLLSRLARTLKREDLPLDYGASWTTLFLSPVLGALTGWFGVALISLLANDRVKLLGTTFTLVDWSNPKSSWTLGIAFVLGFSERLFDSIVSILENHTQPNQVTAPAPTAPSTSTTAPSTVTAAAAAAAASGAPVLDKVTLEMKASGASRDQLVIDGSGFLADSKVTVNGVGHVATVDSSTRIAMPLSAADMQTLSIGGDFDIVIGSANGASQPFVFSAMVTP